MSLETVFGAISGVLLLGEPFGARAVAGCGLMFAGMIALPAATSERTNSGVISLGMRCGNMLNTRGVNAEFGVLSAES